MPAASASWAAPRRSALLTATVHNEYDDGASKTHSCADEMHNVHGTNAREAWTTEHAEKAHETKGAENEENPKGFGAIVHGFTLSPPSMSN
jgi:hypothetical protein